MLIIGSYAISRDLEKCNDVDIMAPSIEVVNLWMVQHVDAIVNSYWLSDTIYIVKAFLLGRLTTIEFEIATVGRSSFDLLSDARSYDPATKDPNGLGYFASNEVCLMLKLSHRFLKNSPHFWKTMKDISLLKLVVPYGISDWLLPILKKREYETYTYSHPKLNTSKASFFRDDNIAYVYDHDELHEVVKLFDKPAYQYFKPTENEVYCSSELFFNNSEEVRLAAVYEESCVLALERSLVPFNGQLVYSDAFALALSKVCTSITSGWFREYAYNNAYNVIDLFVSQKSDFYSKFLLAITSGNLKSIKEKV